MKSTSNTISSRPFNEPLLRKKDIMSRCSVSQATVDAWIKGHRVPYLKLGRAVRFNWSAVQEALSRYERKAV